MGRLIIVSELFYPEETTTAHILTKIAQTINQEREVVVICGPKSYDSNSTEHSDTTEADIGINIKRVSEVSLDKNKLLSRILRFIILTFKLTKKAWSEVKHGDEVFVVTNPAPLLVIMSWVKRIKKFPMSILVHDVFPENTIPAGIIKSKRNVVYKIFRGIFNRAYRSSDRLIVLGRDMQDIMEQKTSGKKRNPEIIIIENWADPKAKSDDTTGENDKEKITLLYAGNVGRVQGLDTFIQLLSKTDNKDFVFSIRGDGAMSEELKRIVTEQNISGVTFGGRYSKAEQFSILKDCDFALITLAAGMYGLGVPSKTYNILQAGKPILFIGNLKSEIALLVSEYKIGYCFDETQHDELIEFIDSLSVKDRPKWLEMGQRAKNLAENIYSEQNILAKYKKLFGNN